MGYDDRGGFVHFVPELIRDVQIEIRMMQPHRWLGSCVWNPYFGDDQLDTKDVCIVRWEELHEKFLYASGSSPDDINDCYFTQMLIFR